MGQRPHNVKAIMPDRWDEYPTDCKVYLLYFSGTTEFPDLVDRLRRLGERTGKNLAVGFIGLAEEKYQNLVSSFQVVKMPAIVITGSDAIASIKEGKAQRTIFVKFDNREKMSSTSQTMDALEQVYNLFLQNKFVEAANLSKNVEKDVKLEKFFKSLGEAVSKIGKYLDEHDFKIETSLGKIDITKVSG